MKRSQLTIAIRILLIALFMTIVITQLSDYSAYISLFQNVFCIPKLYSIMGLIVLTLECATIILMIIPIASKASWYLSLFMLWTFMLYLNVVPTHIGEKQYFLQHKIGPEQLVAMTLIAIALCLTGLYFDTITL